MAAGTIGSTLNTAVQGGNAQDYLRGIGTSLVAPVIGQGIGAGIKAIAPGAANAVSDTLTSAGLPRDIADVISDYTKPVIRGAATGVLKGDILGGVTDAVLGQVVGDVAPSLGLTGPQANAFAKYLRTGDEGALVMSLGSGLAKQAMGSVQDAIKQQGIEQAYNDPSRALDVLPEKGFDLDALLSTLPQNAEYDSINYGDYGGFAEPTPELPQVVITGPKPVLPDDSLDLPPYDYTIPELPLLEPPKVEVEKPTAPPLGGGPTTPTTPSKEFDLNSILNLLGGGGQEPVLSQVLAQMPGFDVESMSQYLREQRRKKAPDQQTQLAELFANIGYRG
jgi:hypothetical protein